MEKRILTLDEWPLAFPVVEGEFGNSMPVHPLQATFPALMDGDSLKGFVHVEHLLHFNCVWLAPELRRQGQALELMKYAISKIPEGFSGIWMTDRNVDRIAKSFGARKVGRLNVYRRDV